MRLTWWAYSCGLALAGCDSQWLTRTEGAALVCCAITQAASLLGA